MVKQEIYFQKISKELRYFNWKKVKQSLQINKIKRKNILKTYFKKKKQNRQKKIKLGLTLQTIPIANIQLKGHLHFLIHLNWRREYLNT